MICFPLQVCWTLRTSTVGQILGKKEFPVKSLMQHIYWKRTEAFSCVRLPGSPTRFSSICGKIRCDKRKKSYDTFNSVTECVYGRDQKCKVGCFPMCFEGKIFHLSRAWIFRDVCLLEQAHWDHIKIINLPIWTRQVNGRYSKKTCLNSA